MDLLLVAVVVLLVVSVYLCVCKKEGNKVMFGSSGQSYLVDKDGNFIRNEGNQSFSGNETPGYGDMNGSMSPSSYQKREGNDNIYTGNNNTGFYIPRMEGATSKREGLPYFVVSPWTKW